MIFIDILNYIFFLILVFFSFFLTIRILNVDRIRTKLLAVKNIL